MKTTTVSNSLLWVVLLKHRSYIRVVFYGSWNLLCYYLKRRVSQAISSSYICLRFREHFIKVNTQSDIWVSTFVYHIILPSIVFWIKIFASRFTIKIDFSIHLQHCIEVFKPRVIKVSIPQIVERRKGNFRFQMVILIAMLYLLLSSTRFIRIKMHIDNRQRETKLLLSVLLECTIPNRARLKISFYFVFQASVD